MGMSVVGLGVLGLSILLIFYINLFGSDSNSIKTVLKLYLNYKNKNPTPKILITNPNRTAKTLDDHM